MQFLVILKYPYEAPDVLYGMVGKLPPPSQIAFDDFGPEYQTKEFTPCNRVHQELPNELQSLK